MTGVCLQQRLNKLGTINHGPKRINPAHVFGKDGIAKFFFANGARKPLHEKRVQPLNFISTCFLHYESDELKNEFNKCACK
jgi:hypothetical protein